MENDKNFNNDITNLSEKDFISFENNDNDNENEIKTNEKNNLEKYIKNVSHMEKTSLMDDPLENKNVKRVCKFFEESSKQDIITDDELSNDFLISFKKSKKVIKEDNMENAIKEEEQFLKPKQWKYMNKINFDEIDKKFRVAYKKINKAEIQNIYNILNEKKLDSIYKVNHERDSNYKINKIQSLDYMIENYIMSSSSSHKKSIYSDREKLQKYIFKFRNISKDINNFYRCIIFFFLENIVLTNNIMFLEELFIEIDDKINIKNKVIQNSIYLKNEIEQNIQIKLIKILLYILIKSMSTNINKSYEIFIKIFLLYEEFDYGMIFILRYLLFEYIEENNYKILSEEHKIELVELLPEKYNKMHVTNSKKFELFYINELFKMNSYADKILLFIIPLFFDINLRIILYVSESENPVYHKLFGKEDNGKFTLELICFQGLFDVCYNKKYYEFHSKNLKIFEEKNEKLYLFKDLNETKEDKNIENDNKNNIEDDNQKNNNNENSIEEENKEDKLNFICENCKKSYNEKENILKLCPKCLDSEFKNDVLKLYILYLQYVNHTKKRYALQIDNYFSSIIHSIKIKDITLFDAMANTGYLLHDILYQVKKDICVICRNDTSKNFFYELPCNCRLCSKTCFDKYIEIIIYHDFAQISKNSFKKITFVFEYCICGKKYYYDDILVIYNYFKVRNKLKECEMIIKIVRNRWKWRCTKCDKFFDPFLMNFKISIFDSKIDKDFYEKELTHLICSECYDRLEITESKNVKCIYCKSIHFIMNAKNLTYENKSGEKCYII